MCPASLLPEVTISKIVIVTGYQEVYHAPHADEPKDLALTKTYVRPIPVQTIDTIETANAGILSLGDEFEFQPNDVDGASWRVFTFYGIKTTAGGDEHVSCYGGEPVRAKHEHDRAWRAFDTERVRAGARPVRKAWRSRRG